MSEEYDGYNVRFYSSFRSLHRVELEACGLVLILCGWLFRKVSLMAIITWFGSNCIWVMFVQLLVSVSVFFKVSIIIIFNIVQKGHHKIAVSLPLTEIFLKFLGCLWIIPCDEFNIQAIKSCLKLVLPPLNTCMDSHTNAIWRRDWSDSSPSWNLENYFWVILTLIVFSLCITSFTSVISFLLFLNKEYKICLFSSFNDSIFSWQKIRSH